jgi:hypothetical protein
MAYITSNTDILLESGSIEQFASPDIVCMSTFNPDDDTWLVILRIRPTGTKEYRKEYGLRPTKADIDAYTGSGTGDTRKIQNAIEQYVSDYLLAINGSTTFTIV